MDNCPYMYFERDGNASITMCSLHPNDLWGVDERTCMYCANADPKWREWKMSLTDQKKGEQTVYYPQVDGIKTSVVVSRGGTLMEYDELIKKLRNRRVCVQSGGDLENDFPPMREAADAIEYLQKSRMDLSNLCLKLQEKIHGLESDDERHERKEGF